MLEIEIDGKKAQVPDGSTVMDAAQQVGVYIPHFCYHKKLSIAANCRMCLVQVEKAPKPLPACATPVTNGMKVFTHSDLAVKAQKGVMEFLLINHPLDCPICDQGGECQLQDMSVGYGPMKSRYTRRKACRLPQECRPADLHGRDEPLHSLHALCSFRPGNRRHHGTRHGQPQHAFRDHHLPRSHGRLRIVGQYDRPLPGWRADLQAFPLHRALLGTPASQIGQPARFRRRQPGGPGQARQCDARSAA